MQILIREPKKTIHEGYASEVVLPGEDGEFSVLDFHQPFLYSLRKGYIRIRQERWRPETLIAIEKGIARMIRNELVITAQVPD